MDNPFDNWEERIKDLPSVHYEVVDENAPTVRIDLTDRGSPVIGTGEDSGRVVPTSIQNDYERYVDFDEIGIGGTGVVNSCMDPHLNRKVAVKVLQYHHSKELDQRTRFVREARVMAQLEHPNILPIHELGVRPDGVIYYSMKKVDGKTLREILDGLAEGDPAFKTAYPREQLLDIFQHICHAMAFAHSKGVIHRDLKPENVLIGPFGEVLVMDWGLAKLLGEEEVHVSRHSTDELDRKLNVARGTTTLDGAISGTPVYMAPEQAEGRVGDMDQRTDIYSLGVILYEILTNERPIDGETLTEVLTKVVKGDFQSPRKSGKKCCIPVELDAICMKAMATNRDDRYPNLSRLIADLENYESGNIVSAFRPGLLRRGWKWCKRHPILSSASAAAMLALAVTLGATRLTMHVKRNDFLQAGDKELAQATTVQRTLLAEVKVLNDILSKARAKTVSEEEAAQRALVEDLEAELMGSLRNADYLFAKARLRVNGGRVPERLVTINRLRIEYLVAKRDFAALSRHMAFVTENILPLLNENHPNKETVSKLMHMCEGCGTLTVETAPANQFLSLWEFRTDDSGLLRTVFINQLGRAPIKSRHIDKGSYLLVMSSEERPFNAASELPQQPDKGITYFPVKVDHAENESVTVRQAKDIPDDMVYVAPGKAYLGGVHSRNLRLHEREVDGFFIKRGEVTFKEYVAFWLAPDGGNRETKHMSRVRFTRDSYRYDDAWDASGKLMDRLTLDRPVVGIPQPSAVAYCQWLTKTTARAVRLPTAEEWEKAARGADGRPMVWGNSQATHLSFTLENKMAKTTFGNWAPPGSFSADTSVYGVQDMAGNVREWTASLFPDSPYFQIKGGSASLTQRYTYCSYASDTPVVPSDVGFRYVMELK